MQLVCDSWLENTLVQLLTDRAREAKLNREEQKRYADRTRFITSFLDDTALQWEIKHEELSFYLGEIAKEMFQQLKDKSSEGIAAAVATLTESLMNQSQTENFYEPLQLYREMYSMLKIVLGHEPSDSEIRLVTRIIELSLLQQAISLREIKMPLLDERQSKDAWKLSEICSHLREHRPTFRQKQQRREHVDPLYVRGRIVVPMFPIWKPEQDSPEKAELDIVEHDPIPTPPEKRHARLMAKKLQGKILLRPRSLLTKLESVPLQSQGLSKKRKAQ
jgi:hypothetical protein